MQVYVCFEFSDDLCNINEYFIKVVSSEQKAIDWCCEITSTEYDWRDYRAVDVE